MKLQVENTDLFCNPVDFDNLFIKMLTLKKSTKEANLLIKSSKKVGSPTLVV